MNFNIPEIASNIPLLLATYAFIKMWGYYCKDIIYESQQPIRHYILLHTVSILVFFFMPSYYGIPIFLGPFAWLADSLFFNEMISKIIGLLGVLITGYIFGFKYTGNFIKD